MARGPKHHLKRVNAPKHWMLGKMDGASRRVADVARQVARCLLLILILRNRLKYAITGMEAKQICMSKPVKVAKGKVGRTRASHPADVVAEIGAPDKFRLLYDTKGRFRLQDLDAEKVAQAVGVQAVYITAKKIVLTTHDGRTIRYPPPAVKVHDVAVHSESGKIVTH